YFMLSSAARASGTLARLVPLLLLAIVFFTSLLRVHRYCAFCRRKYAGKGRRKWETNRVRA
ncbi:MAG: hypothetical protein LBM74_09080, partial [Oscillospiraceae bacterium]|nr:hypothetical protein [Oscillospiraceae bacterium]